MPHAAFHCIALAMRIQIMMRYCHLQRNRDAELIVLVLRRGLEVTLKLKPSVWAGDGLLGCHIAPLR